MKRHSISSFAALTVFALFAICVLCVLLSGAGVYRRMVTAGQESYAQRTCTQYLSTKVRQGQRLSVAEFGEGDALLLHEEIDGEAYLTRVYCHDGWLMELFSAQDAQLLPADGERLLPAQALELTMDDGMLGAQLTDEFGRESCLTFALRVSEGGAT